MGSRQQLITGEASVFCRPRTDAEQKTNVLLAKPQAQR